jgi:hypothetical protein
MVAIDDEIDKRISFIDGRIEIYSTWKWLAVY